MAINFSASFAACLAAGLKVPRQIMYCISQDTGAPYVLYKDGMERGASNGSQSQWPGASLGSDAYNPGGPPGVPSGVPPGLPSLPSLPPCSSPQQPQNITTTTNCNGNNTINTSNTTDIEKTANNLVNNVTTLSPEPDYQNAIGDRTNHSQNNPSTNQNIIQSNSNSTNQNNEISNSQQQQTQQCQQNHQQNQRSPPICNTTNSAPDVTSSCYIASNPDHSSSQNPTNRRSVASESNPSGHVADSTNQNVCSSTTNVDNNSENQITSTQQIPMNGSGPIAQIDAQMNDGHSNISNHNYAQHLNQYYKDVKNNHSLQNMSHHMLGNISSGFASAMHNYLKQPNVMLGSLSGLDGSGSGGHHLADSIYGNGISDLLSPASQQMLHHHQNGTKIKTNGSISGSINGELRLFKCLTCGKDFKQKSTLLQHERIHSDSRPYGCPECGKRFRQQSHLTQHLRIHANEKPYACIYCERTFRQRAILNQHLRIHSGEKPYECIECGKHFRQKAILNQHVRTHQDVSPHLIFKNGMTPTLWPHDMPFPPDEGKEEVTSTYGDTDSQHHGDHTRNSCFSPDGMQYPAYFKDSKGMNHSMFGSSQFNFQYIKNNGSINGSVKNIPDLIQHGRSAGMPLYVRCPICQKEFKQKSTLLQHGCIHIESRPYPCPECGKRFRQQSHLTQHLRIHTNEKPYACIYCGRNFRQRTILNQHLRIHTGEKPYKCQQCGKDFRQKAILDQHTRTHQGDRPFCCPLPNCRRRFATESEVKKHVDNHMNPHIKTRRNSNNLDLKSGLGGGLGGIGASHLNGSLDLKHLSGNGLNGLNGLNGMDRNTLLSSGIVKPELYFPQCYAPSFSVAMNGTSNAFSTTSGLHPTNGSNSTTLDTTNEFKSPAIPPAIPAQ